MILQLNDMKYLQTNEGEKEIVEKNEYVDVEMEEITLIYRIFNITKN